MWHILGQPAYGPYTILSHNYDQKEKKKGLINFLLYMTMNLYLKKRASNIQICMQRFAPCIQSFGKTEVHQSLRDAVRQLILL